MIERAAACSPCQVPGFGKGKGARNSLLISGTGHIVGFSAWGRDLHPSLVPPGLEIYSLNSVETKRRGKTTTTRTLCIFNRNKTIWLALERFVDLKACPFSCLHAARLPARSHCAGGFPFPSPQTSPHRLKIASPFPPMFPRPATRGEHPAGWLLVGSACSAGLCGSRE